MKGWNNHQENLLLRGEIVSLAICHILWTFIYRIWLKLDSYLRDLDHLIDILD